MYIFGPDLIFCVSILELNWIPPISETFIFFEDIDVSVGDVLNMSLPFESIITNLFDAMITSFSSVKYEIEMIKKEELNLNIYSTYQWC